MVSSAFIFSWVVDCTIINVEIYEKERASHICNYIHLQPLLS